MKSLSQHITENLNESFDYKKYGVDDDRWQSAKDGWNAGGRRDNKEHLQYWDIDSKTISNILRGDKDFDDLKPEYQLLLSGGRKAMNAYLQTKNT